jgi:prepilin-type N-terminal cleavage/methylation domain-containing protein
MAFKQRSNFGYSLTELLCVMGIIGVLASIYLGVIAKAFIHAKNFLDHLSGN